jgi:hypothetical protein
MAIPKSAGLATLAIPTIAGETPGNLFDCDDWFNPQNR